MSKPEALELAAQLDQYGYSVPAHPLCTDAAAELRRLRAQRDALLEALKMAWPIIEAEKYKQDCSYGRNFVQTKADRACSVYDKARAAIDKAEGK